MDWLRSLLTTLYAPRRGMSLIRDRSPLGQGICLALFVPAVYSLVALAIYTGYLRNIFYPAAVVSSISQTGMSLMLTLLAFVPSTLFVGNLLDRRGGSLTALKQDYAPFASTILFAVAVAHIVAVPLAALVHISGFDVAYVSNTIQAWQPYLPKLPLKLQEQLTDPQLIRQGLYSELPFPFLAIWVIIAIRESFRVSVLKALATAVLGSMLTVPVMLVLAIVIGVLGPFLSSPLLMLLLFFYLRGYFTEVARTQRSKLAFRQNLEAATLNPADASAHYNLGLLHVQRKEYAEAKERFDRSVKIDPEEVDAHFQLGRIARLENRLGDAIAHFSEVVSRDDRHAQNEVWREIGETYLAAGQYSDSRDALEQFLERRQSDPQGLYLMGRAQAGLGHSREAAAAMEACIEAVKTSPDYKYRTEKRLLNEARDYLGSRQ